MKKRYLLAAGGLAVGATAVALSRLCRTRRPAGVSVVQNFDINKYLGDWYELARFDFRFEKNLKNTRARYTLNDDGTVAVTNSGYDYVKKKHKVANGTAKLAGEPNEGKLNVSFFGPFYSHISHFPNLKKMTLFETDPTIYEELRLKGIDAKPL